MLSPFELLHQKPPNYSHLCTFGCSCFPWQQPLTSHKLQPCAPPCLFLGYSPASKGYRCYHLPTGKIITSRYVIFDELSFPYNNPPPSSDPPHPSPQPLLPASYIPSTPAAPPSTSPPPQLQLPAAPILATPASPGSAHSPPPSLAEQPLSTDSSLPHTDSSSTPPILSNHPMQTRLKSGITKPKHIFTLHTSIQPEPDPTTYAQAAKLPHWQTAMNEEYSALQQQETWHLVPPPLNQNIVGCRWTFKTKCHANGFVACYKARLVAKGFTQEYGTDYHDTFSPVARMATIRTFLTVAVSCQWLILQYDFSNAFLHGRLDETIYMTQPPGFRNAHFSNHVYHLKKALYGLKHVPRLWYSTFSSSLRRHDFQVSSADPSLLLYHEGSTHIYLLIYVYDILISGNNPTSITTLLEHLNKEFQIKSLGPIKTFLGIQFTHTPTGLFLSQTSYIHQILQTSGLHNSKPVNTPVTLKTAPKPENTSPYTQPTHYRSLAGALQYLTITRPDIAFVVNLICQHMHEPTLYHFQLLKRILRYLQATPSYGLPITSGSLQLQAYSDADWAGDSDTRRSTTGYCIYLGSTLISWKVHKQRTVARSSTEAEYRALAVAVTEVIWLRRLLSELGAPPSTPTDLHCDNTSAIALASNPIFHARTKHIEIDFHFVQDHLQDNTISLHYIRIEDQNADIFTKPHTTSRFILLRNNLTVRKPDAELDGG